MLSNYFVYLHESDLGIGQANDPLMKQCFIQEEISGSSEA